MLDGLKGKFDREDNSLKSNSKKRRESRTCLVCKGKGKISNHKCLQCNGSGVISTNTDFNYEFLREDCGKCAGSGWFFNKNFDYDDDWEVCPECKGWGYN